MVCSCVAADPWPVRGSLTGRDRQDDAPVCRVEGQAERLDEIPMAMSLVRHTMEQEAGWTPRGRGAPDRRPVVRPLPLPIFARCACAGSGQRPGTRRAPARRSAIERQSLRARRQPKGRRAGAAAPTTPARSSANTPQGRARELFCRPGAGGARSYHRAASLERSATRGSSPT